MVGADRQQVADGNVGEARSRHADLGGVTKPVDLPQPRAHPVPTGENPAHQPTLSIARVGCPPESARSAAKAGLTLSHPRDSGWQAISLARPAGEAPAGKPSISPIPVLMVVSAYVTAVPQRMPCYSDGSEAF